MTAVADGFDYPVGKPNGAGYYIAQGFQSKAYNGKPHLGEDWNGVRGGNTDRGDPVYSVANGRVVYNTNVKGWGKIVIIRHTLCDASEVESFYAHLDASFVSQGAEITRGQQIGTIGTGGGLFIAHLHFEIRDSHCPDWGGPGHGYNWNTSGWLSPSAFIDTHRSLACSSARYHSQGSYLTLVAGGAAKDWWIRFTNTGTTVWENHNNHNRITKLALGTRTDPDSQDGRDFYCGWPAATRLAVLNEDLVGPGGVGSFGFSARAPTGKPPGCYRIPVTPKTPDGWLQQDDGQDLYCFLQVTVVAPTASDALLNGDEGPLGFLMPRLARSYTPIPVGTAIAPCQRPDEPDKTLVVYDTESAGNRHYCAAPARLDIAQTEPMDPVTIHYAGPDAPAELAVTRDGKAIAALPGSARAGGMAYELLARYYPTADPHAGIVADLLRGLITVLAPPSQYKIAGLPRTITVNAYNPDQWKLTCQLPPLKGLKMGAQWNNESSARIISNSSNRVEVQSTRVDLTVTKEATRWRETTTEVLEAHYEQYTAKLTSPRLYAYAEGENWSVRRQAQAENKVHKALSLERNSAAIGLDLLDLIGGIISLVTQISKAVKNFQDFAPKVGWYLDFELKVLDGKVEIAWGWRECEDCRVYYYFGLAADLTVLELMLEFGFGVAVAGLLGQVCVRFTGSLGLKAGAETIAPDADSVTLGALHAQFDAGGYVRFKGGDLIEIEGGIKSGISFDGKVEAAIREGLQINGDIKWDGLSLAVRAKTSFGYKRSTTMKVVEPEKMGDFRFPGGKDSTPSELSKHEISIVAEKVLQEGWDIRVYEQRAVHRGHLFTQPTMETEDVPVAHSVVADLIAERLWRERDELLLDEKTINGLMHGIRKKCEIISAKDWGRDWLYRFQLEAYLADAEFSVILRDAADPGKIYKKEMGMANAARDYGMPLNLG